MIYIFQKALGYRICPLYTIALLCSFFIHNGYGMHAQVAEAECKESCSTNVWTDSEFEAWDNGVKNLALAEDIKKLLPINSDNEFYYQQCQKAQIQNQNDAQVKSLKRDASVTIDDQPASKRTKFAQVRDAQAVTTLSGDYGLERLKRLLEQKFDELGGDEVLTKEQWVNSAVDFLNNPHILPLLDIPELFKGELRDYQKIGVAWLAFLKSIGAGACLADDMGLGKTVQIIAFLAYDRITRQNTSTLAAPTLIVCPPSLVNQWKSEIEKFAPSLPVEIYHTSVKHKPLDQIISAHVAPIIITTYDTVVSNQDNLTHIMWDIIILDEAHYIKNPKSKRAKTVKQLKAVYKIAITGTPITNGPEDAWSIVDFIIQGYLGTLEEFKNSAKNNLMNISACIQPFMLRRSKMDKAIINDLPEKQELVTYCTLTQEQIDLYNQIVTQSLAHVDVMQQTRDGRLIVKGLLPLILRLKQVCDHPVLVNFDALQRALGTHTQRDAAEFIQRSGKLIALIGAIQKILEKHEKVLIFTQFAEMAQLLQKYVSAYLNHTVLLLDGSMTTKARDNVIKLFDKADGPSILVVSLKVGGCGLNLISACNVIHFDRWWNAAVEEQANDRVYRIGQKNNVQIQKLVCKGTIEDRIAAIIAKKREVAQKVIKDDLFSIANLKELKDLLELNHA